MGYPETFTGFAVQSPKTWSTFEKKEVKPKPFGDHDIDIEIECCGVCGSDVHTLTGGWGEFEGPLVVGHEVVGKAVKVGKGVRDSIKEGDRVGVGAQVWSCLKCTNCKTQNENYCPKLVDTYNAQYPEEAGGGTAHGGYASHIRAHEYFTWKIPDAIKSSDAAPLMCAGLTTYSPLVRAGVGPGKNVAIAGIGGLGHLAVQWAAALGANTYAFTHSQSKVEDIKKLGAKEIIVTSEKGWDEKYAFKFDFILSCMDVSDFDINAYLGTLKVGGTFHSVGLSDAPLPEIKVMEAFAGNAAKLSGSHLGNHQEMDALLKLAAEKNVKPWVETIPLSEAGAKEAVERVKENKVHYRFTLVDFDKAFARK
jgi:alcohol dehydrogenase (NADP+)